MDSVEESPAPESFDVDEWDENFINEVLQIELGLAAKNAVAKPADPPPPPPPPVNPSSYLPRNEVFHRIKPSQPIRSERGVPPSFAPVSGFNDACFSPPRELSQRFSEVSEAPSNGGDCVTVENKVWRNGVYNRVGVSKKNTEVERLKKELEHLSKKFKVMEQDCITLKRDRDKKVEQLNCVISKLDAKDAEIHSLKRVASPQNQSYFPMLFEDKAPSTNYVENNSKLKALTDDGLAVSELKRRVMLDDNATTSCGARERSFTERSTKINHSKSTGIQTDINEDIITIIQQRRMLNEQRIVSNLHAIWGLCDKRSGNTLVSKLLKTCSEDFFALFRCTNMPSNCNHNELTNESISEMALDDSLRSIQSSDAAKASQFYQSLMKMRHEIVPLQVVIDALLDLCNLNNVTVAHVSLHILHAILQDVGLDSSSLRSI